VAVWRLTFRAPLFLVVRGRAACDNSTNSQERLYSKPTHTGYGSRLGNLHEHDLAGPARSTPARQAGRGRVAQAPGCLSAADPPLAGAPARTPRRNRRSDAGGSRRPLPRIAGV